jgi:hypothetical protein
MRKLNLLICGTSLLVTSFAWAATLNNAVVCTSGNRPFSELTEVLSYKVNYKEIDSKGQVGIWVFVRNPETFQRETYLVPMPISVSAPSFYQAAGENTVCVTVETTRKQ